MITYEEAIRRIREIGKLERKREVTVATEAALKMVLSKDITGGEDVPLFDNSAMDGFAVCAVNTENATPEHPVLLKVHGFLAAGDETLKLTSKEPGSVEIMTGAPMPGLPFDAVVRVEDTKVDGSGSARVLQLTRSVRVGENVRPRGNDFRSGQLVAKAGSVVTAAHIMAFASLGIDKIHVLSRPKVAILSTGKELRNLGEGRLLSSQIWNSSGPYLENWLKDYGCEVKNLGIIADSVEVFQERVREALAWGADILLSTGAVSMGKHDFVVEAFRGLGAELHFHKVAIRPGKPICFGEFRQHEQRPVFFGLPGNPISTAVGLRFFVEPYLRVISHQREEKPVKARLLNDVKIPEGFRCFYKAKVSSHPAEGLCLEVLSGQGSYVVSSFLESNCWAVLPELGGVVRKNAEVAVFSLNGNSEGVWNG